MANTYADRVQETSTTTGTGTYSLAGATTGYQTFVAGAGDASTVTYVSTDGTDWEVGTGTVTDATPDTLSRDTIISSSNGGSAVNWAAGTRTISLTYTSTLTSDVKTSIAVLNDTKAANTAGGGFTSGAWQTRTINTTQSDADSITSLSTNQITLQAGTYMVIAECPAYAVARHKARLQNVTDATTALLGSSSYAATPADSGVTCSEIRGIFTISAAKAFELQHQCQQTKATNGFGLESNFSVSEIYSQITIMKLPD